MTPRLIAMLTYNDVTVKDALDIFDETRNIPVMHWGFKDIGLSTDEMRRLVERMKSAGKITYLEIVSLTEQEGMAGARLAVECDFDVLMGTIFFDSINNYLQDKRVKYFPFVGHVHGHPSILGGTIDEIVQDARKVEAKGVEGIDLLTHRYTGDARELLRRVVRSTNIPVISAGSIDRYDRIMEVAEAGAWGFTIGSAFFDQEFIPGGSFGENLLGVHKWLEDFGKSG